MRVLVVGDTHGNAKWWDTHVGPAIAGAAADVVIQLGDFGFWGGLEDPICVAAANAGVPVYFFDGNHENHPLLDEVVAAARTRTGNTDPGAAVHLDGDLWFLPRGARLTLDGVRICVLGGAVSIDSGYRTAGIDWFPGETITEADLAVVAAGGAADILLTHDAPGGYRVPGTLPERSMSHAWRRALPACEAHRDLVTAALEATHARHVIHGHYHSRYSHQLDTLWGAVQIDGIDCDGTAGGLAVLTVNDGFVGLADLGE